MEEYDLIINKVFEDLEEVSAPREDYERALARLTLRAQEVCEAEGINPARYSE